MPNRWCTDCGTLFDMDTTSTRRCPPCQRARDNSRGTTTQRGYGRHHQQTRAQLIAAWTPGDPCSHCGQPMHGPSSALDLAHTPDRTGYRGLAHAACNRGNR